MLPATLVLVSLFGAADFKFAVVGDTQARRGPIFNAATQAIKKERFDFVSHVGDVWPCMNVAAWKRRRARMRWTGVPWYMTIGNHERFRCNRRGWVWPWRKARRLWVGIWYNGSGDTMKVWTYRRRTFIALDTAGATVPRGHVARLKRTLAQAKGGVYLFAHRPLPHPGSFPVQWRGRRRWYTRLDGLNYKFRRNRNLWKAIARHKRKVRAIFHGHHHAFIRYKLSGIPTWCTGGGGGALDRGGFFHFLSVAVKGKQVKVDVQRLP